MSEPQSNEGKGRPTPTRREAEAKRPRRSLAPAVNKADRKSLKAQQRKKREELRGAYMRGEERALPTRDKGPARKFARNYVDSRYSVAEFLCHYLWWSYFCQLSQVMESRFWQLYLCIR